MFDTERIYLSVHDRHCCPLHGCKYGKDTCPVELKLEPGVECESCEYDMQEDSCWEIAYLMDTIFDLRKRLGDKC